MIMDRTLYSERHTLSAQRSQPSQHRECHELHSPPQVVQPLDEEGASCTVPDFFLHFIKFGALAARSEVEDRTKLGGCDTKPAFLLPCCTFCLLAAVLFKRFRCQWCHTYLLMQEINVRQI
ncbi:uncharacterized protein [Dermacentor albipictus]|uniref:uncharacterized protein isoform X2 n=1 Tax=Dermacentor albipictus TaxID=60249 RepID=UPI0038FCAC5C